MRKFFVFFLVLAFFQVSCVQFYNLLGRDDSTPPSEIGELEPVPPIVPNSEPEEPEVPDVPEEPEVSVCEFSDQFLRELKGQVPYDEFALGFNIIENVPTLTVWYVDPLIDLQIDASNLEENMNNVFLRAIEIAVDVRQADPCVDQLVEKINPIAVDRNYFGWFSGEISPADLPPSKAEIQDGLSWTASAFNIGFARNEIPPTMPTAPAGSCTWVETKVAILQHFAAGRENITFQFTIDGGGTNLWAQWDGPSDIAIVLANLMNITMELDCLYPAPTRLVVIVVNSEDAAVNLLGVIDAVNGVLDPMNFNYVQQ